jgi:hypothetical protein
MSIARASLVSARRLSVASALEKLIRAAPDDARVRAGADMSLLREFHPIWCPCSICDSLKNVGVGGFGFLAPIDKTWNAWRWVFWIRTYGIRYVRWTGFWQKGGPR